MDGNEADIARDAIHFTAGRVLPENCAEYAIFVLGDKEGVSRPTAKLEKIRKSALKLCGSITKNYIWQRDPFRLEILTRNGMVYLHGITDYSDCVEDEWLIVYMLRELSILHPEAWIRIWDNDGEFLLIEAAQTVPTWLNPGMDVNRPWIHCGRLEIIRPAGESLSLALSEAVKTIQSTPEALVHLPLVEKEAFYRLGKYPGRIASSTHCARTLLPRKVAYILHERPAAIAPAVEAFYMRDPAVVGTLLSENRSALRFPPADLVDVSVKFTKVLFAQLRNQRFTPSSPWAAEFASHIKNQVQQMVEGRKGNGDLSIEKLQVMANLGMKVTCGFELMASTAETSNSRVVREVGLLLGDLEEDGDDVAALPCDADMRSWEDVRRDDDESWLTIDFDELERELGNRNPDEDKSASLKSGPKQSGSGFGDADVQTDLRKIVSRFEAFMDDDHAGLEGAEFGEGDDAEDEDDEDDEDNEDDEDEDDGYISFDENEFSHLMREMMGLPPLENKSALAVARGTDSREENNTTRTISKVCHSSMSEGEADEEILRLAAQFEAELKGHGALRLDQGPADKTGLISATNSETTLGRRRGGKGEEQRDEVGEEEGGGGGEDDDDRMDDVNIDYNLAKNLLESFKSQEGTAGPASNILGMLGVVLPRDDSALLDDDDEDEDEVQQDTKKSPLIFPP